MQTLLFIATLVSSVFGVHAPIQPSTPLVPDYVTSPRVREIVNQEVSKIKIPTQQIFGAAPSPAALATYTLSGSGVSSSATSITLTSLTIKQTGQKIQTADLVQGASDKFYITIEPGNVTRQEIVGCTGVTQNSNSTATLTGCSRGMSPIYPYTASTTLRFTHAGSSQVIFGDAPQIFNDFNNYVASAVVSGAVDSSATVKGIVEKATVAEAAAHAGIGSGNTTAPLVLTTDIASSTRTAATAQVVIASTTDGYIDNGFLNIEAYTHTFTRSNSFSTSTGATTTIGAFPAWQIGKQVQIFSTTGTTTFSIPSGINKVHVQLVGGGGAGGGPSCAGGSTFCGGGGGGAGGYSESFVDVSSTSTVQLFVGSGGAGSSGASGANGTWSTFGTNGFYMNGNGGTGGSGATVTTGGAGGTASGGTIVNITGGAGSQGSLVGTSPLWAIGAAGGNSIIGFGGGATITAGATTGSAATNYGGGGSGGGGSQASGAGTGGAGAQGIVIVTW